MVTILEVREAIARAGVQWEAADTKIAKLLKPSPDGMLGLSISEEDRLQTISNAFATFAAPHAPPPAEIDWRDHNGVNRVSPVKDQGACGSCVAFATVATMESRLAIAADSHSVLDLSEAHLFFCGAGRACGRGWNFEPALAHCRDVGVGYETDFAYDPHNQPCKQIQSRAFVRNDWDCPVRSVDRKWAIATSGPVIAGMRVFEDFGYYAGGVYRHVTGAFLGLHAVCVVGYSDKGQYWIVKNSWSSAWGEQGFVRIGYGQVGLDSEFPFYVPEVYAV